MSTQPLVAWKFGGMSVAEPARLRPVARGVEEAEVLAALTVAGARVLLLDDVGSVRVVGSGIGRQLVHAAFDLDRPKAEAQLRVVARS